MLEQDKGAKAIFIYPTKVSLYITRDFGRGIKSFKALAQDQKASLEQLLACCPGLESIFVGEPIVLCLHTSQTWTRFRHTTAIPHRKRDQVSSLHKMNDACT
jgi:hypothetical protein